MAEHIAGFAELGERLKGLAPEGEGAEHPFVDLRQIPFEGAEVVDPLTYRIRLKGKYPQFAYWLAMPFFAPMPWEAEAFYNQPGMRSRNLTLDWYPVGTGPYWLKENNPNLRMVLERNPNFRGETYPSEGMPGEAQDARVSREAGAGRDKTPRQGSWPTPAGPCPWWIGPSTAWRRRASPTGTSSCRAITTAPGSPPTPSTRPCSSTPRARRASPRPWRPRAFAC